MNIPLMPTLPPANEPEVYDRKGYEFVNGEWVEKHPQEFVEVEHDRKGCEFIDGDWVEKDMSCDSDYVGGNLLTELKVHARAGQLGRVQGPECGYQCFADDPRMVRKPDVSFLEKTKAAANRPARGNILVAPDFAAEVISPNENGAKINRKVVQYLRAGVRLVWVVWPETRSVWVFRADGTANWVTGSGTLSGEDVIPGFTISLDTLFADI